MDVTLSDLIFFFIPIGPSAGFMGLVMRNKDFYVKKILKFRNIAISRYTISLSISAVSLVFYLSLLFFNCLVYFSILNIRISVSNESNYLFLFFIIYLILQTILILRYPEVK